MDNSVVKLQGKAHRRDVLIVRFTGNTAVTKGQPLCWDFTNGRDDEVTTITTSGLFAGVAAYSYAAVTGGQEIAIYTPGSVCEAITKYNCSIGTALKLDVSDNAFAAAAGGTFGIGVAIALEAKDTSTTAGLTKVKLVEGGSYVAAQA